MREIYGVYEEGMLLADMHVHTNHSIDARNKGLDPHEVVDLAAATGLSAVVITDHHTIKGAEDAKNYAVKTNIPVTVYVGVEVTTKTGAHVVGFDVTHPVLPTVSVEEAIDEIVTQHGLVILPHPFYTNLGGRSNGIQQVELLSLIEKNTPVHGFEVFSQGVDDHAKARPHTRNANRDAIDFYMQYHEQLGAAISSSDTHRLTVGRARTGYHKNVRTAIENRQTVPLTLEEGEMVTIFETSLAYVGPQRMFTNTSRVRKALEENKK